MSCTFIICSAWIVVSNIHVDDILGPSYQTFSQNNCCCTVNQHKCTPSPAIFLECSDLWYHMKVCSTSWTKTIPYIILNISHVCCCILYPTFIYVVVFHTLPYITPMSINYCKCTYWSFEADLAIYGLILCHHKFIIDPMIKVPSLFHGRRCVGIPPVAIYG